MITQVIAPREGGSCILSAWHCQKGDRVHAGDALGAVETDKAVMDILSPGEGMVLALLYAPGDEVPPCAPIAVIGDAGEAYAAPESPPAADMCSSAEDVNPPEPQEKEMPPVQGIKATPKAKKYAWDHGISLEGIAGTGPQQSVCYRDVAFRAQTRPEALHSTTRISEAEPYTLHTEASADVLLRLRSRYKASEDSDFAGITVSDMLMLAVARTLPRHPALCVPAGGAVNLAFKVDTPAGQAAPVIHGADRLSLRELSMKAKALAAKAREGRLAPEETGEASFTVSNLGSMGITYFTPRLTPPQVALLGVGKIRPLPQYDGADIRYENVMTLSLTADNRAADGATSAKFLADLCGFLKDFDLRAFL